VIASDAILIPQLSTAQAGKLSATHIRSVLYLEYHHSWGTVDIWGDKAPP